MERNKGVLPQWVINTFFVVGIFSAGVMRLLIVVNHIHPSFVRGVWYVGVLGYLLFFGFRYYITRKRKHVIRDNDLIGKVSRKEMLSPDDKEHLEYILMSISRSKELFNYSFIFITSFLAIVIDMLLVLIGK